MSRIAILSPAVQRQIAAGEVIERPASVVKELVENALDAGARHIEVTLRQGGIELIAVRDDGVGMSPADAVLAFARHATSKLVHAEELASVRTLGFRGEALPSIAAAGAVRLITRPADAPYAVTVDADGQGARLAGPAAAPPGTIVEVRDLFATTPARRKFLRTAVTEVGHVVDLLTRLAVACPRTGFRLEHDGREVIGYPPVGSTRQRLAQVLGAERAASMVEVEAHDDTMALKAYLAPPRESLATARLVWTFVAPGGAPREDAVPARWVRDRLLLRAVLDGYETLLMRGRYPVAMLFLAAQPGEVDVNVHPAKLEVRFRRPAAAHRLIVAALRARLAAALKPADVLGQPTAPAERLGLTDASSYIADAGVTAFRQWAAPPASEESPAPAVPSSAQGRLWQPAPEGYATLRFVGQLFDGYLLCEGRGRLVLIDQHAAHERIRFERLRREQLRGGVVREPLLVPEAIALSRTEVAVLEEQLPALAAAGLEGEAFGADTFLLRTVPRLLRGCDPGPVLRAVAGELLEDGVSRAAERALEAVLSTIACHSAVRVGQRLEGEQVRALLEAMDGVDLNAHCPHGRPVAIELTRGQVEAFFGR